MTRITLIYTDFGILKKSVTIRVNCVIRVLFQCMSKSRNLHIKYTSSTGDISALLNHFPQNLFNSQDLANCQLSVKVAGRVLTITSL